MRRFKFYRPNQPEHYETEGYGNPSSEVQFEGIQFTDGTVVVRWLTEYRSTSLWPDFETLSKVHGHADYGSYVVWLD